MHKDIRRTFGRASRFAVAVAAVATMAGCTTAQKTGESASYLILDALAASGANPTDFGGVLSSDVRTKGGILADNAQATFTLGLKDPGGVGTPTVPSPANFITITRYRVKFVRSDGRNVEGVDVPYAFDGAVTATVGGTQITAGLNLVRVQAKLEAPLLALAGQGGAIVISTIAEVTFYGHDQAGREVSVTGFIGVNFADWADPD
jgi:hypothetical protein